jgi:hypothetical protein
LYFGNAVFSAEGETGNLDVLLLCDFIITHSVAVCKEVFVKNTARNENIFVFFV